MDSKKLTREELDALNEKISRQALLNAYHALQPMFVGDGDTSESEQLKLCLAAARAVHATTWGDGKVGAWVDGVLIMASAFAAHMTGGDINETSPTSLGGENVVCFMHTIRIMEAFERAHSLADECVGYYMGPSHLDETEASMRRSGLIKGE